MRFFGHSGNSGGGSGEDLQARQSIEDLSTTITALQEEIASLPTGGSGSGSVIQKTFLNVTANSTLSVLRAEGSSFNTSIVQVQKFVAGSLNVVGILKTYNNGESSSFYYDANCIDFNGSMKIKDDYSLSKALNNGLYESEVITKGSFVEFNRLEVGI